MSINTLLSDFARATGASDDLHEAVCCLEAGWLAEKSAVQGILYVPDAIKPVPALAKVWNDGIARARRASLAH